ncbi:MAG: redoxin family protein [Deltaproteobacteria bacterium]|nr:redoxin family protein [Deltaproteobacteria bacterium]
MKIAPVVVLVGSLLGACAHAPTSPRDVTLVERDGASRALPEIAARAPLTVLVFVAADCPCLHAHLPRLRELAKTYGPRGVQFVGVDSEVFANPERARQTERDLDLPFPVVVDHGARLANALGAEYATFTAVLDRSVNVHYRGGIDSDKRRMHDGATPYLREVLDDLLAGKPTRRKEGKALGCVLRKW